MSKHTATPWFIGLHRSASIPIQHDGRVIALVRTKFGGRKPTADSTEQGRANAEFIVRAVNTFDGMLRALRNAEGILVEHFGEHARTSPTLAEVRAAIAKARGQS